MRKLLIYTLIIASGLLSGCSSGIFSIYRLDIQQGNAINAEAVDKLREGMSPSQVRFIMGTPLLNDAFHEQRWDYLYWFKPSDGKVQEKRVTVFFQNGQVARIEKKGLDKS